MYITYVENYTALSECIPSVREHLTLCYAKIECAQIYRSILAIGYDKPHVIESQVVETVWSGQTMLIVYVYVYTV